MKAAILVNYSSNNNAGKKKWLTIQNIILKNLPNNTNVIVYSIPFDLEKCLRSLIIDREVNCIISAGGDGSLNYILNTIINNFYESTTQLYLGAIGLGSSNDYLKPFSKIIARIPVKINLNNSNLVDIGKVSFIDSNSKSVTKYFIANASLGVTADANFLFNKGDYLLNFLKPRLVNSAIIYAALKTIIGYRNKIIKLSYLGKDRLINASNISVVKNPNISGSFKYDQKINPDDGMLGLNYCFDMNLLELIKILNDLRKGRFSGKPKRISELVQYLKIETDNYLALETDGEVEMAKDIEFTIMPKSIHVLGS
jgi:diacylglycerol kinase family enzyme